MTTEPIRDRKQLQQLAGYWLKRGNLRNYTLIVMGVYTALRISDLLRLTWSDLYDMQSGEFRSHINITEHKTGKRKTIALNSQAMGALHMLYPSRRSAYVFSNNYKNPSPITRVHAWRIIRTAAEGAGLAGRIACHSLRKTFGYHAWKNGTSPVVLMDIYNHTSYDITRRYLGVSQDDRDKVYLKLALF